MKNFFIFLFFFSFYIIFTLSTSSSSSSSTSSSSNYFIYKKELNHDKAQIFYPIEYQDQIYKNNDLSFNNNDEEEDNEDEILDPSLYRIFPKPENYIKILKNDIKRLIKISDYIPSIHPIFFNYFYNNNFNFNEIFQYKNYNKKIFYILKNIKNELKLSNSLLNELNYFENDTFITLAAKFTYTESLLSHLTGIVYGLSERSVIPFPYLSDKAQVKDTEKKNIIDHYNKSNIFISNLSKKINKGLTTNSKIYTETNKKNINNIINNNNNEVNNIYNGLIKNSLTSNQINNYYYFSKNNYYFNNNITIDINIPLQSSSFFPSFSFKSRYLGEDWPLFGLTMIGMTRLRHLHFLYLDILSKNIQGVILEAGSWRGGTIAYLNGLRRAYNDKNRIIISCDSFSGLPPSMDEKTYHKDDYGWDNNPYVDMFPSSKILNDLNKDNINNNEKKIDINKLSPGYFQVISYLDRYSLLDQNVIFAKGFFNETMPILKQEIEKISILRLDGDIYESTVDVLYNLYDKLEVGGYVVLDDWNGFPAKIACEDFFRVHSHYPKVIEVDRLSAYWIKHEDIKVDYNRYINKNFK